MHVVLSLQAYWPNVHTTVSVPVPLLDPPVCEPLFDPPVCEPLFDPPVCEPLFDPPVWVPVPVPVPVPPLLDGDADGAGVGAGVGVVVGAGVGQAFVLHGFDSDAEPTQSLPPWAGEGLVHVLERTVCPPPHFFEHGPHASKSDQPPSTGHGLMVHVLDSVFDPLQVLPPCAAGGLSQALWRV